MTFVTVNNLTHYSGSLLIREWILVSNLGEQNFKILTIIESQRKINEQIIFTTLAIGTIIKIISLIGMNHLVVYNKVMKNII